MFRVEWLQSALDELAAIWTQADSALRQAITQASHAIDQELQDDPLDKGESRSGERRVLFVPPLGIAFEVDEPQQVVTVSHVWTFRSRHP